MVMKAKPYKFENNKYIPCEKSEATHVLLKLPGPLQRRMLPIRPEANPHWTWNGDLNKPTLKPSILSTTYNGDIKIRCHSFVTDGQVKFLTDSTHEFAGQTLDLLDVDL